MTELFHACSEGRDHYALRNEANRWCGWNSSPRKPRGKPTLRQSEKDHCALPTHVLETRLRSKVLEMPGPSRDPSCWFLPVPLRRGRGKAQRRHRDLQLPSPRRELPDGGRAWVRPGETGIATWGGENPSWRFKNTERDRAKGHIGEH